jgi:hypothetical protein
MLGPSKQWLVVPSDQGKLDCEPLLLPKAARVLPMCQCACDQWPPVAPPSFLLSMCVSVLQHDPRTCAICVVVVVQFQCTLDAHNQGTLCGYMSCDVAEGARVVNFAAPV